MSRRPVRPHGPPPATVAEAFEDEVAGWLQVLRAARARDWPAVEFAAAEGLALAQLRRRQLADGRLEDVSVRQLQRLRRRSVSPFQRAG